MAKKAIAKKADDKLQMEVSLKVKGKEGLDMTLNFTDTDIGTVLLVEGRFMQTLLGIIEDQKAGKL